MPSHTLCATCHEAEVYEADAICEFCQRVAADGLEAAEQWLDTPEGQRYMAAFPAGRAA